MLFVLKMEFRKNLHLVSFIKSGVNSIMVNIQDTLLQELGSISESHKTNKKKLKPKDSTASDHLLLFNHS